MRNIIYSLFCYLLLISSITFAQAPNDECATATVISSLPFNTTQDTRLATPNATDPTMALTCNDTAGVGKSVWFVYTADIPRTVWFSTVGSTPVADFDIMMGVFTGTCGSLTELECNDDAQATRQSELFIETKAGTTYYILVGEWSGGGTSGGVPTGGDLVFKAFEGAPPPPPSIVKGPKFGTSPNGVMVNTDDFASAILSPDAPELEQQFEIPYNDVPPIQDLSEIAPSKYPSKTEKKHFKQIVHPILDASTMSSASSRTIIVKSYKAFPSQGGFPPDPIMAVGPNHVIAMVNSSFRIFEKNGKLLKTITAAKFFQGIAPNSGPNDPQIIYDHYANRWVMMWMTSPTATDHKHLFAASDDSNPLGVWYQWSTSAISMGDSLTTNWGDYPSLGYDSVAIYLGSHQFGLTSGSFAYNKLRIIPKAQMYTNNAAAIPYTDFWDFKDTVNNRAFFGLRPVNGYTKTDKAYFICASRFTPSKYIALYTLSNPISNTPTFAYDSIHVQEHRSAPAPHQLGGDQNLEGSGFQIRANGVFRDSSIWLVHSVASGDSNQYSSLHYVRYNPFSKTVLEDDVYGNPGFYYFYPAIAVNKNKDIMITYSRSGLTEYVGAFLAGRKNSDPPGVLSSATMHAGEAYYVKLGSGRNRWGDYSGAALDPADQTTMWAHTEYVPGLNDYATWLAASVMGPLPGGFFVADQSFIDFGVVEVNTKSKTNSMKISNGGLDTLRITNVSVTSNQFAIANMPALPLSIPSDSSFELKVFFQPTSSGLKNDTVLFATNDPNNPLYKVILGGNAFEIVSAISGTMYAVSGSTDGGNLFTVSTTNATPTLIKNTTISQINCLRVHPTTKQLIGYNNVGSSETGGGAFYRISADGKSFEQIAVTNVQNLKGLAIYNDSLAYTGAFNGTIYSANLKTGELTTLGQNSGLRAGGLAINPVDGTLWMSLRNTGTGGIQDNIYKLDRTTGKATLVGKANVGIGIVDIVFDKNGRLFGLSGTGTASNKLLEINTTTGVGSVIGDLGKTDIQAIALDQDAAAGVAQQLAGTIPTVFMLEQNYPNPFNPTTTIKFGLPSQSNVVLTVYDVVGREVSKLAEGIHEAGIYSVQFDASKLSSGVYYYKISAGTFSDIKKMLILK